jgi:hypothetical protein
VKGYHLIHCTYLAGRTTLHLARSCTDTDADTPDSFLCAVAQLQLVGHFGIDCLATCLDPNTTASVAPFFIKESNISNLSSFANNKLSRGSGRNAKMVVNPK